MLGRVDDVFKALADPTRRAILDELNHPLVTQVDTMDGAADKAAELAHQA